MGDSEAHDGLPHDDAVPAEAGLARLFDLSLDLLCIAGLDGYFKHVNPAFSRVLGYASEDLLSKAFIEFVHPDDRDATLIAVEDLANGRDIVDFENRYRAADGSWRWLAWRSTSVPGEGLIFATARDITDHKRLQALADRQADELARSNADLDEFASIASHDLQAPLRAVRTLADWIEEELAGDAPDKVIEYLRTLRDRVDLMTRLVSDLLAYARAGRGDEASATTDTARLVARIAELLGPPQGFTIEASPQLPTLETTPAAIEQVLRNLIGNAIDHHDRETGTVTVTARPSADAWEFCVADDGPGIDPKLHDKVFEMLWSSRTAEAGGTGIGLALVKRIVERVGGRVWIETPTERGTEVHFLWPRRIES